MNKLSRTERAQIVRCLVEGNSIRSTARLTGAARNTITTLLVQLGTAPADAKAFIADLHSRVMGRIQITTDGHLPYIEAVEASFGTDVDYAMLIKDYGIVPSEDGSPTARRYSPNRVVGSEVRVIAGDPDPDLISTSIVERNNLSMRMGMRRFTRLTNGFSKKVENHTAMVSLHFMAYNFARPHGALAKQTTPAMAAGVADHVWTAEEIAGLIG